MHHQYLGFSSSNDDIIDYDDDCVEDEEECECDDDNFDDDSEEEVRQIGGVGIKVLELREAKVKREEKRRERKFRRERGGGVREGAREAEKGSCWIVEKLRGRFIRITKETST
ncbi:hypothetical protein S83_024536 [Arachis hypogaea]